MADTILGVTHVEKEYVAGDKVLDDINFSLERGQFVSIIGKSGAGKSTLLRCLNRMIDITSGEITFEDQDISQLNGKELRALRREIGMIFQHYNLVDRSSVLLNTLHGRLGYTGTLKGMLGIFSDEEKEKASTILKTLGLENEIYKRCDELSGGQKQRVGIARALLQEPELILCDEPIASLDPSSSKVIMEYLKTINEEMGITVFCSLHQVDVALTYSDRIIGIAHGKVVFDGLPSELTQEKVHEIYGAEAGDLISDIEMPTEAEVVE